MTLKRTDSKVDKIKGGKKLESENREQIQLSELHLWASEAYRALDRNGLDCLDYIEINTAIHILGIQISPLQVHEKLHEIDHLQTGRISLEGFLELVDSIETPKPLPIRDTNMFIAAARKSPSARSFIDIQRMVIFLRNKYHLFKERRLKNLERLCYSIGLKEVPRHDWVVRQNDIGDKVYVIIRGACGIFQKRRAEDTGQDCRQEEKGGGNLDNANRTKNRAFRRVSLLKSPIDFLRSQAMKQSQMTSSTSSSLPSSTMANNSSSQLNENSPGKQATASTRETSSSSSSATDHEKRDSLEEFDDLTHSDKIMSKYSLVPKQIKEEAGDFLGTLSAGSSFGELSLQNENKQRTSSVISLCNTILLEISQQQYEEYIGYDQQPRFDDLQYYMEILKKPPVDRTATELKEMVKLISELAVFRNLKESLRLRLVRIMVLKTEPSGRIIFRQGEEGDAMYVVLSGACTVRLKRDGPPKLRSWQATALDLDTSSQETPEMKQSDTTHSEEANDRSQSEQFGPVVKIIQPGDCFGEAVFLQHKYQNSKTRRSATIIVLQSCALAKVSKADYFEAVSAYQQDAITKGVEFVNSLPVFQGSSEEDLSRLYGSLKRIALGKDETVCKQGLKMNGFFIVAKGEVELGMKIRPFRPHGLMVESKRSCKFDRSKVVFLGPGCVFGEESLLGEQALYTVVTTQRSELFYVTNKDFEKHTSRQLKYRVRNIIYSLQKWLEDESKKYEDVRRSINGLNSRGHHQKSSAFQKLQFKYRLAKYGSEWWNEFDRRMAKHENDEMNYTSTQWERLGLISLEPVLRDNGSIHRDKKRHHHTRAITSMDSRANTKSDGKPFISIELNRAQGPSQDNTAAGASFGKMRHSLSAHSRNRNDDNRYKPSKEAVRDLSTSDSSSARFKKDANNKKKKRGNNTREQPTKPSNDWDRLVRSSSSLSSSGSSSIETASSVQAPAETEFDIAANALISVSNLSWQTHNILPKCDWVTGPLKPFKPWKSTGLCYAESQMRELIRYRRSVTQPRKLDQHRRRRAAAAAAAHARPQSVQGQPPAGYNDALRSPSIDSAILRQTGASSRV